MRPWNIAHRGGALLIPENTLTAFADAVRRGCDGTELDVQLSRDGHVVVHHDFRLKPDVCRRDGRWIAAPTPRIKDLSLAELRSCDIGRARPQSAYAMAHESTVWRDGEAIPTLAEVVGIAGMARGAFRLFVELKTCFADRAESAPPEVLAAAAVSVLAEHDFLDRTVFVGFDWAALLEAKRLAPQAQCWFTTLPQSWFDDGIPAAQDDPPAEPALQVLRHWARTGTSPWAAGYDAIRHGGSLIAAIKAAGGDGWFPYWRDLATEYVQEARGQDLRIGCWTVNDPAAMRAMKALGVDAVCTDRPDLMAGLIGAG